MTTSEFLQRTRDVISTPRKWIKGHSHKGVRHCIYGAMWSVRRDNLRTYHKAQTMVRRTIKDLFPERIRKGHSSGNLIAAFNDSWRTRHKDVLRVLDTAIEKQQAKEMWAELKRHTPQTDMLSERGQLVPVKESHGTEGAESDQIAGRGRPEVL